MSDPNLTRLLPLHRFLQLFALLILPLCGAVHAQSQNRPSVTGHFVGQVRSTTFTVTVAAVQLPNGDVVGQLMLEQRFEGVVTRTVVGPIEELEIIGNRAYVRVGTQYLLIEDNGEGAGASPDRFVPLRFVTPPGPPLSFAITVLDTLYGFGAIDVVEGVAQVRE